MSAAIKSDEEEIVGAIEIREGHACYDPKSERIFWLVENELRKIAKSGDGWDTLFLDQRDGRYWELTYPDSHQHGGGAPVLRNISFENAGAKYVINGPN